MSKRSTCCSCGRKLNRQKMVEIPYKIFSYSSANLNTWVCFDCEPKFYRDLGDSLLNKINDYNDYIKIVLPERTIIAAFNQSDDKEFY